MLRFFTYCLFIYRMAPTSPCKRWTFLKIIHFSIKKTKRKPFEMVCLSQGMNELLIGFKRRCFACFFFFPFLRRSVMTRKSNKSNHFWWRSDPSARCSTLVMRSYLPLPTCRKAWNMARIKNKNTFSLLFSYSYYGHLYSPQSHSSKL